MSSLTWSATGVSVLCAWRSDVVLGDLSRADVDGGDQAQLRCGRAKVTTRLVGPREERLWVVKGPAQSATQCAHMRNMVLRSWMLSCVAPELTIVPCALRTIDGELYLAMPNVGKVGDYVTEDRESALEKCRVVKRESHVLRVSEARRPLSRAQLATIWSLFVWQAVMGVGDAGTYNMLLTIDGHVVAIDMEETRQDDENEPSTLSEFLFKRPPTKALRTQIWEIGREHALPHWRRVEEQLSEALRAALGEDALAQMKRRAECYARLHAKEFT